RSAGTSADWRLLAIPGERGHRRSERRTQQQLVCVWQAHAQEAAMESNGKSISSTVTVKRDHDGVMTGTPADRGETSAGPSAGATSTARTTSGISNSASLFNSVRNTTVCPTNETRKAVVATTPGTRAETAGSISK